MQVVSEQLSSGLEHMCLRNTLCWYGERAAKQVLKTRALLEHDASAFPIRQPSLHQHCEVTYLHLPASSATKAWGRISSQPYGGTHATGKRAQYSRRGVGSNRLAA